MMGHQYLLHHDKDASEIQLRVCDSDGIFYRFDGVFVDKADVPDSFNNSDEWLVWTDKWRQYFSRKYHINANKIQ